MINLFILPISNKNNKYIKLFHDSLVNVNKDLRLLDHKKNTVFGILVYIILNKKTNDKNIIHIHWPTILYGSRYLLKSVLLLISNIFLILFLKYILGVKFVWTLHNFYSHDFPHPIIDKIGTRFIRDISDRVIVQQKSLKTEGEKYVYIPHGNYINAYGPIIERDNELRESFGFKKEDILLISIGSISPYKLNEKIIKSVINARKHNQVIKLLIIGKGENKYVASLENLVEDKKSIIIKNIFVPDQDIPKYLSISDYSIFYYDDSEMTSGGIILSLSYGVKVIARRIPGSEMVNANSGYLFSTTDELEAILLDIKPTYEKAHTDAIIDSVKSQSWDRVGAELNRIYISLFNYEI